ncbi:hypothetical protein OHL96_002447 [Enterococcus faecium]|jgi:hypothetical protein|uniref:Uncharacterized protein n=1 Tax=Enterococcus lactis TaxID=357441 RepID=A0A7W2AKM7_9ENTE|nr:MULTISPECIES: hypothetical protein [Enterococcus]EME7212759.1 hypothetical protein [Enterococcus faecium]MBA4546046.1 hypothetical protein [Enterococcus lactis]MBH0226162.1 hypothetical protein [Enterococcus lactis]MDQ0553732.1 hypothetical protein [Enterococcus lactis]MUP30123.1 hypothetical protein [Enterococcus lactis]
MKNELVDILNKRKKDVLLLENACQYANYENKLLLIGIIETLKMEILDLETVLQFQSSSFSVL